MKHTFKLCALTSLVIFTRTIDAQSEIAQQDSSLEKNATCPVGDFYNPEVKNSNEVSCIHTHARTHMHKAFLEKKRRFLRAPDRLKYIIAANFKIYSRNNKFSRSSRIKQFKIRSNRYY